MKTAIILPGKPSKKGYFDSDREAQSNEHWLPWIQHELLLEGILAQAIELPTPYDPSYEDWKEVFEQFDINENTHLIGHSCGGGFLTRWLSENDVRVGRVALVAPWLDPEGELGDDNDFFKFIIDGSFSERAEKVGIFVSNDDDKAIIESVDRIKSLVSQAQIFEFSDKGHFTMGDMNTEEFPELIEFLLDD